MSKINSNYQLLDLLDVKDLLNTTSFPIDDIFDTIADKLINEYQIRKNGLNYDLLEVEIYYLDKNHKDIITYPRTIDEGKWFFHSSGVDISFKSLCDKDFSKSSHVDTQFFGGILIRSMLKDGKEIIAGPLKCSWELFDCFNAFVFHPVEFPIITKRTHIERFDIYKTTRWISYKEENAKTSYKQNFDSFIKSLSYTYRYYVKHPKWEDFKTSDYTARPWGRGNEEIPI